MKKKLQLTLFFLLNTSINVSPFICFGIANAKCTLFWGGHGAMMDVLEFPCLSWYMLSESKPVLPTF